MYGVKTGRKKKDGKRERERSTDGGKGEFPSGNKVRSRNKERKEKQEVCLMSGTLLIKSLALQEIS